MASTVHLVGPGLIALIVLAILIWAASAFAVIDSLRRRRTDYAGVGEGRWFYAVPQAVFFVAFFAWQIPWVQTTLPWIGWLLLGLPLILAQQMAYLLRVVFPTAKRLEKRLEAERAAGYPASHVEYEDVDEPLEDDTFFDDEDDAPGAR